jgi:RNA polymerase sigma-70 factor, ECF subfamily
VALDDARIMQQVQQGEFALFDELVHRYREPLVRVACSKLGDPAWAEDAVQETFLAVFAARHTYNPQFAFRTWLWTILLNACRRQLKRRHNRPREFARSPLEATAAAPLPEPECHDTGLSRLLLTERREQLAALLDELPEVQADALRLRFYGGLKFSEIAEAMGSSLGAAKVRVKNGLLTLASRLRDEGYGYGDADGADDEGDGGSDNLGDAL